MTQLGPETESFDNEENLFPKSWIRQDMMVEGSSGVSTRRQTNLRVSALYNHLDHS